MSDIRGTQKTATLYFVLIVFLLKTNTNGDSNPRCSLESVTKFATEADGKSKCS